MQTEVQQYEELQNLFDMTDRFVAYGEELSDICDNIRTICNCVINESSTEGILFINSLVSFEADATTTTATKTNSNPDKKSILSKAALNAKDVTGRIKELLTRVGSWVIDFFRSTQAYAQKNINALNAAINALRGSNTNLNFKLKNICMEIGNVSLTPWVGQVNSAGSKEALAGKEGVLTKLRQTLQSAIVAEERTVEKNQMITILQSYVEANSRIATSDNKTVQAFTANAQSTVGKETDSAKMQLTHDKTICVVNCTNEITRFVLTQTGKLLNIVNGNMKKNDANASAAAAQNEANSNQNTAQTNSTIQK